MMTRWISGSLFAVLSLLLLCARAAGETNLEVYRADLVTGKIITTAVEPAPRVVEMDPASLPQEPSPGGPTSPPEKLHPRLLELLKKNEPSVRFPVIICFEESVTISRFPSLDPRFPREAPENRETLEKTASLIRELEEKRALAFAQSWKERLGQYDAKVTETFWLINGVVADMPLGHIPELAQHHDVLSIVPVDSGEPPPVDKPDRSLDNNVDKARAWIASDPYYNLRLAGGHIGLLDTGVRSIHRQLATPGLIASLRDCVNGNAHCGKAGPGFDPDDNCWNHGTSSAAILAGNDVAGNEFRGVTGLALDSFKVYPTAFSTTEPERCTGTLNSQAAVLGFQAAVAARDEVIVAQIQGSGHGRGCLALAANAAHDAGAVVVAANGNFFDPREEFVAEPASASRVLGVGSFNVIGGSALPGQRHGPTADGRIKPDFQTPTNSETASTGCGSGLDCRGPRGSITAFRVLTGTSGATPYAGGAAALLRNFAAHVMKTKDVDPGFVYALMMLSGQSPKFDNFSGTGKLQLPTDGTLRWGVALVKDRQVLELPISLSSPQKQLDAALWWPEDGVEALHNNIDLLIVDPAGVVQRESRSQPSVFERARVQGTLQNGTWKVRIEGNSVKFRAPQRVYFAILNR